MVYSSKDKSDYMKITDRRIWKLLIPASLCGPLAFYIAAAVYWSASGISYLNLWEVPIACGVNWGIGALVAWITTRKINRLPFFYLFIYNVCSDIGHGIHAYIPSRSINRCMDVSFLPHILCNIPFPGSITIRADAFQRFLNRYERRTLIGVTNQ